MVLGDAGRAPLMLAIPLLHEAGLLSFPLLLLCVFAIGCFIAPYFSAQRLILPELVGDDEATVAQANAVVEGTQRATALLGPALAGILIAVIGAANVLYVDAASYLISFLILVTLVPRRPPVAESDDSRGLLAGIRFLLRDPLLRMLSVTALFLNMFGQMLSASLPVLAYEDFDRSSTVAGLFFAAFGAGSLVGVVLALKLVPRFDPIRLGAVAIVALTVPIPLLGLPLPAGAVVAVLFTSAIFGPLVNAPLIGVLTMRTRGAPSEGDDGRAHDGAPGRSDRAGHRRAAARVVGAATRAVFRRAGTVPGHAAVRILRAPLRSGTSAYHARSCLATRGSATVP
jgi:predicted MFS family arabinose efflux permease